MRRALVTTTVLGISLLTSSCGSGDPVAGARDHVVTIQRSNGVVERLHVSVADDDTERAKGLMGVTQLPPNQGMAFVFQEPSIESFWMKDTLIPLSVAFVDAKGEIVTIREMEPCRSDPCPTYDSDAPYVMAIEANRGWFEDNGVRIGDPASLEAVVSS
ncbi:MAG: DUF192 domain-containing protein [Actinomycetota bacterium]